MAVNGSLMPRGQRAHGDLWRLVQRERDFLGGAARATPSRSTRVVGWRDGAATAARHQHPQAARGAAGVGAGDAAADIAEETLRGWASWHESWIGAGRSPPMRSMVKAGAASGAQRRRDAGTQGQG
jgi:hypothetical protein